MNTRTRWLRKLFDVLETPLLDYLVAGKTITSLKKKGLIRRNDVRLSP